MSATLSLKFLALAILVTGILAEEYNVTDIPPAGKADPAPSPVDNSGSWWPEYASNTLDYLLNIGNTMANGVTNMYSSWSTGTPDLVSIEAQKYPPNFNSTKEEIVEIDGKKFLKKFTIFKSTTNGTIVFDEHESLEPLTNSTRK